MKRSHLKLLIPFLLLALGGCPCKRKNPTQSPPGGGPGISYYWIDGEPSWSPDGSTIAYTHTDSGKYAIWLLNLATRVKSFLVGGSSPAWSPDGRWLAFVVPAGMGDIFIIQPNGDSLTRVTFWGYSRFPRWLPDGRLSFNASVDSGFGIWVMNKDGTGKKLIPLLSGDFDWSPDGTILVFWRDFSSPPPTEGIYVADSSGNNQRLLSAPESSDANREPRWSPDGSKVAFSSQLLDTLSPMNGQMQITLVDSTGSGLQKITPEGGQYPSWSPDGSKIVYCRLNTGIDPKKDARNGRLWMMNKDGTGQEQLTFP
jgi:Tol biopolymer transport system component